MGASAFVFPTLMGLFFIGFLGWVNTVPVEPAPEVPEQRFLRAQPGDSVSLEVTGWYSDTEDGEGVVFFSTQEERHQEGDLPTGDVEPRFDSSPVPFRLSVAAVSGDGSLGGEILGKRVDDPFTTQRIAPEDAFGDWERDLEINRSLDPIDLRVTLGGPETPWTAVGFPNFTSYEQFWARNAVILSVGVEYGCEGRALWQCRVESIDRNAGTVTYSRMVSAGLRFSLGDLIGGQEGAEVDGTADVVIDEGGETFHFLIAPVVGDLFQLRQGFPGLFEAGTWRITAVDAGVVRADYSPNTSSAPGLIGKWIWYDLVLVEIVPPAPVAET